MLDEKLPGDVFEWLDSVRKRPGMYFTSLAELENLVWGYQTALWVHDLREPGPSMQHFGEWLAYRTSWSLSCGWARAICDHAKRRDPAAVFFRHLDEFRRLRPTLLAFATLSRRHEPTGKRRVIGFSGRMERPDRVEIVRLRPEPLHFLRFHHGRRVVDDRLLYTTTGSYRTTIREPKRWAFDELCVQPAEWRRPRRALVRAVPRRTAMKS